MVYLSKFNLNDYSEWESYLEIYIKYTSEICSSDDEFKDSIAHIKSEDYHKNILKVFNRSHNKFHICRILKDNIYIGFCDYICYIDENGKCLIGNFYIYPEFRSCGFGTDAYLLMERELINLGGKYIDITPSSKAISFYLRKGFFKTEDISLENGEIAYRKVL